MKFKVSYISGNDLKLHTRTVAASDRESAVKKAFELEGENFENRLVDVAVAASDEEEAMLKALNSAKNTVKVTVEPQTETDVETKAKYRVWAKMTTYSYIEVEAGSESEAISIAEDTDGGEFITSDDGDWEITEAELI